MFECLLENGDLFRKVIAAVQDLVTEGNFQCTAEGISMQGMDSSHVSLIALSLRKEGFSDFRCDKEVTLGVNFNSLSKILKCIGSRDKMHLRADDEGDSCVFMFQSPKEDRISNFELKLMEIDSEQLGIPETDYSSVVRMPSGEFQRIITNLGQLGDTVSISASKDGVKFSVSGDMGTGEMMLRQSKVEDIDAPGGDDDDDDDDDEGGESSTRRGKKSSSSDSDRVMVEVDEPVSQNFAIRYLTNFTKATNLSKTVTLSLGAEVPMVVEYMMDDLGSIAYYLAPKIDDDE